MPALCATQDLALRKCLAEITRPEGRVFASLLLTGPPGSGKRTLAASIADALGTAFIEVPLAGSGTSTRARLFGNQSECLRAMQTEEAPGELAARSPCLFYLSRLEELPEELHQEMQRLLAQRAYRDLSGRDWQLPNDLILVAGLTEHSKGNLTSEHWLIRYFGAEVPVRAPHAPGELQQIVSSMISGTEGEGTLIMDLPECAALAKAASGNLHRLRGWIERASTTKLGAGVPSAADVWKILDEDAEHILSQIVYTGSTAHVGLFHAWAAQFPKELSGVPLKLVQAIRSHYYVSPKDFFRGIQYLIDRIHLSPPARVVFCNWQHLGRSGPLVANELKNRGGYRVAGEIDLTRPPSEWPNRECIHASTLLVADDFAGSGKTLNSLFLPNGGVIRDLLQRYPECEVKILLLVAYEDAIPDIRDLKASTGDRIAVHIYRLFKSSDRCFTTDSRIFPDEEERDQVREFCSSVATKHYPRMFPAHSLGFNGVGSLCVFHNTVPNNTLPIIWYDRAGCGWKPLFPARGLDCETTD